MAEEEGFRVTDRRGRQQETDTPAAVGRPGAEKPSPPSDRPSAQHPDLAPGGVPDQDLSPLFIMFASSALISLGEAPDPVTGEQRPDPEQAREAIETLLLLRSKTEGNRTQAESRLLDEILYDLQMRFLRVSGPAR